MFSVVLINAPYVICIIVCISMNQQYAIVKRGLVILADNDVANRRSKAMSEYIRIGGFHFISPTLQPIYISKQPPRAKDLRSLSLLCYF